MWGAIAAAIGLAALLLGAWLKRSKKTPRQRLLDDLNKKRRTRSKIKDPNKLAFSDWERRNNVRMLLRLERDSSPTKRPKDPDKR